MALTFSNYTGFAEQRLNNFVTAVTNFFTFLPYFFSVKYLIKTFFSPWKNITEQKRGETSSLNDTFSRLTFNVISRFVGAGVRGCVILLFITVQIITVLLLPILFTVYVFLSPLVYIISEKMGNTNDQELEEKTKGEFIRLHTLDPKNENAVTAWYTTVIKPTLVKSHWYDTDRLFSTIPIGRNWTTGYTPTMDLYCVYGTKSQYESHLIGRNAELTIIEQTLIQNQQANILLVGNEGVGRDSIIQYLSDRIYHGKTNPLLAYKRVLKIDVDKILSFSTDKIVRKETLSAIFQEAQSATNIILVIHDLQKYTSDYDDNIDISDILERYAASNRIHIIATSTPYAYQKNIFPNQKIRELFIKVDITELSAAQSLDVLLYLSMHYEKKYKVILPFETIFETNQKATEYITAIPLPESAIQLLDQVCASVQGQTNAIILPEMVRSKLESRLHIPTEITPDLKNTLLTLEDSLNSMIIDQKPAMKAIANTLKNTFVNSNRQNKPLATFLFLGPTGVGKTESAKALTSAFFKNESLLIRLDMGNFQTKEDISSLLGDNQNPGLLTTQIGNTPYGVLLLDEIEKALPDLLHIFLTVIDEGYFVNGRGERVPCNNLVIIATSNAGANFIFSNIMHKKIITTDRLITELINNKLYAPEFLNRFDGVIMFSPLSDTAIFSIAKKIIDELDATVYEKHKLHLTVTDITLKNLIAKGYNPEFGVRDLKRLINSEIETIISSHILNNRAEKGTTIQI